MSKPIPVSDLPDEIVDRVYIVRKAISGPWHDSPALKVGKKVNVRRSPHLNAPRSYWIEETDGSLLAVVTETRLRDALEEVKR